MQEFAQIIENQILPLVNKPGRYVGNELHVIKKNWDRVEIKFALAFPDLYEIAMSHVGFEILYQILNKVDYVAAERVYAPATDLEEKLREKKLPLFSLESRKPIKDFDIVGFTLQYELHFSNILNMLDLSGIPLLASDRGENDPLVIAGGPCAFNPEPIADFFDAFVIGDGEEAAIEFIEKFRALKKEDVTRTFMLNELAKIKGVYVPSLYEAEYDGNQFKKLSVKKETKAPEKISARIVESLKPEYYPTKPLVPLIETTHDRYSVEIMRGCTQGCRFCNAGYVYRPVRERSVDELERHIEAVIRNTGYDEISLASLSTSDYSQLKPLLTRLIRKLEGDMVTVSFPSLRTESFTREMARFSKKVRKSGLTLAPEAGSVNLRNVINKTNTNEDLLRAAEIAFSEGWNSVKLYFMIGLPQETEADLQGIVDLVNELKKMAKSYRVKSINISVSPFCPKSGTPFQWVAQNSIEEMRQKIFFLKDRLNDNMIKFSWRDPEVSFLEAVMARGDRRLGAVIQKAWQNGAKFDAWTDHFDFQAWLDAFRDCEIDPEIYIRERQVEEPLPWDHIDKGIPKKYLIKEYQKALSGETTQDCRTTTCHGCGLMKTEACQEIINKKDSQAESPAAPEKKQEEKQNLYGRSLRKISANVQPESRLIRLQYAKGEEVRFTSHLDLVTIFERAFRRAGIKLVYSQGFHPHPKIAYSPPLAIGFTSEAEYLDVQYFQERGKEVITHLNRVLPQGLRVLKARMMFGKPRSLASVINRAIYEIKLPDIFDKNQLNEKIINFIAREKVIIERQRKNDTIEIDIRPFVEAVNLDRASQKLILTLTFEDARTARVQEVLREMFGMTEEEIAMTRVHRKALLIEKNGRQATPLEMTGK